MTTTEMKRIELLLTGAIVDVGDMPSGRGFALKSLHQTITITGLSEDETRQIARRFGNTVTIKIEHED